MITKKLELLSSEDQRVLNNGPIRPGDDLTLERKTTTHQEHTMLMTISHSFLTIVMMLHIST